MSARTPLRVLLAEDEPLARQALRRFVTMDEGCTVVGEAEDVPALQALIVLQPADVLFLDITMPGGSGLDVVSMLPSSVAVVFTTAHAEHAVTAYALDAVDYLVKPFGRDRVLEALARVRRLRTASAARMSKPRQTIVLRVGTQLHPLNVHDVWRLEGCDDFVRVVTAQRSVLHGETLSALHSTLDAAQFLRLHRSHVVNLRHVTRVVRCDVRRLAAEFSDGSLVVCSRAGSALLRRFARNVDDG